MSRETGNGTGHAPDEAVEVLRGIWEATGQGRADLEDAFGPQKSCKSMSNVGFDGLAGPDGDTRSAWRAKLEREGKLSGRDETIADLVLGRSEPPAR